MSGIKALDEMRDLRGCIDVPMLKNRLCADTGTHSIIDALEAIADEAEREIAERFIELPRDADGVAIRVGDTLQLGCTRGEVVALKYRPDNGELPWEWQCDAGDWYNSAFASHVKPRTLEVVLAEMQQDTLTSQGEYSGEVIDADEWRRQLEEQVSECADEIRAMFGEAEQVSRRSRGGGVSESRSTRYSELFGTPERAARTSWYMLMCKYFSCDDCPITEGCDIATDADCEDGEAALLEWLREKVD